MSLTNALLNTKLARGVLSNSAGTVVAAPDANGIFFLRALSSIAPPSPPCVLDRGTCCSWARACGCGGSCVCDCVCWRPFCVVGNSARRKNSPREVADGNTSLPAVILRSAAGSTSLETAGKRCKAAENRRTSEARWKRERGKERKNVCVR